MNNDLQNIHMKLKPSNTEPTIPVVNTGSRKGQVVPASYNTATDDQ